MDNSILDAIDGLQLRYLRALDRKDMTGWLDCFDRDAGGYVCTTRENEAQGLPVALMMDDTPQRLSDRVRFITEVWSGTFEDYETRHFVQRIDSTARGQGLYAVTSNVMVVYTSARRHSEILAAGVYEDEVAVGAGGARFRTKKAILDTVTTPRYLVYPI